MFQRVKKAAREHHDDVANARDGVKNVNSPNSQRENGEEEKPTGRPDA